LCQLPCDILVGYHAQRDVVGHWLVPLDKAAESIFIAQAR
jgi:hypothetical protein